VPSDDGHRGLGVHVRVLGPPVPHRQAEKAPLLGSWLDSSTDSIFAMLLSQEARAMDAVGSWLASIICAII